MSMGLDVVELEEFDLPLLSELIELQKEAFGKMGLGQGTLPLMIRYGRVFLLKKDGETIGSAEFMRDWKDSTCVFLVGFSIRKGERQKGRGKFFLKEILSCVREQASRVRLTTSLQNQAAMSLYERFGFQEVAFYKDEFGAGEDRLLLELQFREQE